MVHVNENLEKRDVVDARDSGGVAAELNEASLSTRYVC